MTDTLTLSRTNGRGKAEKKTVKQTLDIRDFKGRPGFALLLIAANPHLSVTDILECLRLHGVGRSRTWVTKRRWLFQDKVGPGGKADVDGKDNAARKIMGNNPTLSLRDMSILLAENGIVRGKDWIRRNRGGLSLSLDRP
jgi:hypothetical protein